MIRIGIVGCGRILAAHLRGYRLLREAGLDDFRITALCARREDDATMYVRRGNGPRQRPPVSNIPGDPLAIGDEYLSDFQDDVEVQVYTDYRQMIAEAPIDAINDFTIHSLHHQIAAASFAAGKDLLTQKPLALTIAAGRRMCEEADARDRVFGVFENFRQSPGTRHLRWLFQSGLCGQLQMMLLGYVGVWWAPNLVVAETPWRHAKSEGGGISLDLGVHFFDQIRTVAGEIDTVSAQTSVLEPKRFILDAQGRAAQTILCDADDTFMAQIRTRTGVVGNLFASWGGHGESTIVGQGMVYYGSGGKVTGTQVTLDPESSAAKTSEAKPTSREFSDWGVAAPKAARHHVLSELYDHQADAARKQHDFPRGLQDGFALAQHDWLEAIRHRREPETSGWEGLKDLAAAFAILESAHAGRTVQVSDVLSGELCEFQRPINEQFGLK